MNDIQEYMDSKKYDTKNHKEVANIVKRNLKANNYNLTNTELLHLHEIEIVEIMVFITNILKKYNRKAPVKKIIIISILALVEILNLVLIFVK